MSIYVECDQCQKKYQIQEHLAGRRLPCKECGAEFQVPDLEADVFDDFNDTFSDGSDDRFELDPSSKRRSRRQQKSMRPGRSSGSNSTPWIIGAGAILAVLVLIAVLTFSLKVRRDRDDIAHVKQMAAETDADEPFANGTVGQPPGLAEVTNSQTVFVFQVLRVPHSADGENVVDVAQVASQALSTMRWGVPGSVKYDAKTRELTVEIKATTDHFEELNQEIEVRLALNRVDIFVGTVRSPSGPPPAGKNPPASNRPPAGKK